MVLWVNGTLGLLVFSVIKLQASDIPVLSVTYNQQGNPTKLIGMIGRNRGDCTGTTIRILYALIHNT